MTTLDHQYRCPKEIMAVVNRNCYPGISITTDESVTQRPSYLKGLSWSAQALYWTGKEINGALGLNVIDGVLLRQVTGTSKTNIQSVKGCQEVAQSLEDFGFEQSKITIISFYAHDRNIIGAHLIRKGLGGVVVYTVDSYQGRENDVVIINLVSTMEFPRRVGHIKEKERVNVALSLPKALRIFIGHYGIERFGTMNAGITYLQDEWSDLADGGRISTLRVGASAQEILDIIALEDYTIIGKKAVDDRPATSLRF